jgi:transporter family-2 protein
MNAAWLYPLIVLAGALQALGNTMNAQLRNAMVNPWLASAVSFAPILVFFACAFMICPRPLPTTEALASMPWWAPLGGLAGAVAVYLGLTMIDKVGAGQFNGLIITANIVASLAIDHFGLMRMPVHALNPMRIVGALLMVLGVFFISKF